MSGPKKKSGKALSPDEAALILRTFNITQAGNFLDEATRQHTGANIFHLNGTFCEVARKLSSQSTSCRYALKLSGKNCYRSGSGASIRTRMTRSSLTGTG